MASFELCTRAESVETAWGLVFDGTAAIRAFRGTRRRAHPTAAFATDGS